MSEVWAILWNYKGFAITGPINIEYFNNEHEAQMFFDDLIQQKKELNEHQVAICLVKVIKSDPSKEEN